MIYAKLNASCVLVLDKVNQNRKIMDPILKIAQVEADQEAFKSKLAQKEADLKSDLANVHWYQFGREALLRHQFQADADRIKDIIIVNQGTLNSLIAKAELLPHIWTVFGYDIPVSSWHDRALLVVSAIALPSVTATALIYGRVGFFHFRHSYVPYPEKYVKYFGTVQDWTDVYIKKIIASDPPQRWTRELFISGASCVGLWQWIALLRMQCQRGSLAKSLQKPPPPPPPK